MTDSHEEFGRLAEHGPFYDLSCVTFAPAKKITGLSFSEDMLSTRFLSAAVRDR
ncbi:hypothetical protein [Streptosporangium roseum]|uniref:hypothetical protein n=1 Tax=Streptosporangium roseum TaxID=2001 RepID=UPI00331E7D15